MSQSSNDTFPTAMHIAAVKEIKETLLPKLRSLQTELETKARQWQKVVKIGRTHLEDAVPLTVDQEWSGYAMQIHNALMCVEASLEGLYQLAAGGTAVGTGLNTPKEFGAEIAQEIAELTGYPFITRTPHSVMAVPCVRRRSRPNSSIKRPSTELLIRKT